MVRRGRIPCALLEKPIEQLPAQSRIAPVESESVLIEIGLELFIGCTALESAEQPCFEQRSNAMGSRQFFASGSRDASMPISILGKPSVGPGTVADDQRTFGDGVLHEADNGSAVIVGQLREPNPSDPLTADFSRDYHDILCLPGGISRRQPADKGLVDLDIAGKLFASRSDHSSTQLVQHDPRRFVTGEAEQSLESQRIDSHFLVCHPPHGPIPQPQRDLASMEDRSGHDGYVRMAALAMESPSLGAPGFPHLALGADEAIRPTKAFEVSHA